MTTGLSGVVLATILSAFIALSARSQTSEQLFQKGNSLYADGKYEEALILVDRSLNLDSSLYQRFGFRAELKTKLGRIEEAIADISKCIQKCKCQLRNHHVSDYYLERAELQFQMNNQRAAMEDVNKSISHNPGNWKAYNFRSTLFISDGQMQKALADLNKSISINDNESLTFIDRAKLKIQMGDVEGACTDLSHVAAWGISRYDDWISKNCKKNKSK